MLSFEQQQEQAKDAGADALVQQAYTLATHIEQHANDRGTSDRRLLSLIVRASELCMQANRLVPDKSQWAASHLVRVLSSIKAYSECEECDC